MSFLVSPIMTPLRNETLTSENCKQFSVVRPSSIPRHRDSLPMFCMCIIAYVAYCRLYYHIFRQAYGPTELQVDHVRQHVDKINNDLRATASAVGCCITPDENFIAVKDVNDNNTPIIVLCTPLMKCVHVHRLVKHTAEMVFVDAGGNMDRQNLHVFMLMTHSPAGALPIGVLILPNEQCATIVSALQLYLSLLDDQCFGGRGVIGPLLFMTDDSSAERNALQVVFPEAVLLLCVFHILQAYWRFLWDSKTNIVKESRRKLFSFLKSMLYSTSEDDLQSRFEAALSDSTVNSYPNVHSHLQALYERRAEWALCYRADLPVRGNNTNNFCESVMRVMKDKVLNRTKAFNVLQLLDFVITRLDHHYQCRLIEVANSRLYVGRSSRFTASSSSIESSAIRQLEDDLYEVPSETTAGLFYCVDMSVGCCGCPVGTTGGPCKHQAAVTLAFKLPSWHFLPTADYDTGMRRLMYIVATGDSTVSADWFASLTQTTTVDTDCVLPQPTAAGDGEPVTVTMTADYDETQQVDDRSDDDLIEHLHRSMDEIEQLYRSNPATYGPAIKPFCHQTDIASESGLQSALHCFGKYTGAAPVLTGRSKVRGLKRIGVQPTAVARRKMPVSGRRHCHLGRPPRSSYAPEQ